MAESTEETSQRKSWYREGDNGSFHLVRYLTPATLNDLSTAARAALSMTDICCDRGHGRVSYLTIGHCVMLLVVLGIRARVSQKTKRRPRRMDRASQSASDLLYSGALAER